MRLPGAGDGNPAEAWAQWGAQSIPKGLKFTIINAVNALGKTPGRENQGREMARDNFTKGTFSRQTEGAHTGAQRDGWA